VPQFVWPGRAGIGAEASGGAFGFVLSHSQCTGHAAAGDALTLYHEGFDGRHQT
jgi:hypothetical protein